MASVPPARPDRIDPQSPSGVEPPEPEPFAPDPPETEPVPPDIDEPDRSPEETPGPDRANLFGERQSGSNVL